MWLIDSLLPKIGEVANKTWIKAIGAAPYKKRQSKAIFPANFKIIAYLLASLQIYG